MGAFKNSKVFCFFFSKKKCFLFCLDNTYLTVGLVTQLSVVLAAEIVSFWHWQTIFRKMKAVQMQWRCYRRFPSFSQKRPKCNEDSGRVCLPHKIWRLLYDWPQRRHRAANQINTCRTSKQGSIGSFDPNR